MSLEKELKVSDLRSKLTQTLWKTGFTPRLLRRVGSRGRFALAMHGVSPEFDPTMPAFVQPHHTAEEMRLTLAWLRQYFAILNPEQYLYTDEPGLLLTFDDGFSNNAEVLLPILEEFEAPAVFFVTLQHILNPKDWLPATRQLVRQVWEDEKAVPETTAHDFFDGMSTEKLQLCANHPLVTIGSHSIAHSFLSKCSLSEQEEEIAGSKRMLEELIGMPVELFAYPTGDYDQRAVDQVRQAGYKAAFAVSRLKYGALQYEIPRIGLYSSEPSYLGLKLSGLYQPALKGKIIEK